MVRLATGASRADMRPFVPLVSAVVIAILFAVPSFFAPLSEFDGGISASAAAFTLHGLLPYRDYWLLYGPLSGYLLALPTAVLGPSVELTRACGLLLVVAQVVLGFQFARRWTSGFYAALIAVAAVALPVAWVGLEVTGWSLAMVFALAGLYVLGSTRRPALFAGLLLGLAFVSRLDVGAYALIAALLLRDRSRSVAGFGLVAVPFLAMTVATTAVPQIIEQLIWYPVVGPRQFRGLPGLDTDLSDSVSIVVAMVLIIPRALIVAAAVRIAVIQPRDRVFAALTVFAACAQLQTLGRADIAHLAVASTPALLLLARFARPIGRRSSVLAVACVAPVLAVALLARLDPGYSGERPRERDLVQAVRVTDFETRPDEPIFVGSTGNRFTFNNPLIAYYLADRAPGTRWTMYNPGVTNRDETQKEMVEDLLAADVRILLLDASVADLFESQNDSHIPGSTILDDFIASRYRLMCSFGDFRVMALVDSGGSVRPCPDPAGQP